METSLDDPLPSIFLTLLSDLPPGFYIINISLVVFLLLCSGLISGSEVAFFSLNLHEIEESQHSADKRITQLLRRPKKLLASVLILNNLVNVLIVTISTYATWQIVGGKDAGGLALIILTGTVTILIIFIGEIVPKVFASHRSLSFARFVSAGILICDQLLTPLSLLLLSISSVIERRINQKGYQVSVDELNQALDIAAVAEVSQEEKGILKGIVNFGTLNVKQVMMSRMDITAIDNTMDFHSLMDLINKTGYSRYPVYSETIDKVDGLLYIKDVLPFLNFDDDFKWQTLLRPAYFVPESKKIDDLFKDFQEKHVHMAIVIDEYGGTEGLITMEDIIEEIVGEINDEFDDHGDEDFRKLDDHTFIFEGRTSLNDFGKMANVDVSVFDQVKGESESLGGLLLELNSKLPSSGERIHFKDFKFTIVAVDTRRIKRVRVEINKP